MASFAKRPNGSWEIRESVRTDAGPRSRTLATFRGALTAELIERAVQRSARSLKAEDLRRAAARAGVQIAPDDADQAARALLFQLANGHSVRLPLARVLTNRLSSVVESARAVGVELPPEGSDVAAEQITSRRLVDVLELAEALPYRPSQEIGAPPLAEIVERRKTRSAN